MSLKSTPKETAKGLLAAHLAGFTASPVEGATERENEKVQEQVGKLLERMRRVVE